MSRRTALSWNTSRRLTPANLPTTLESGSTPGQSEVPAVRFSANGLTTLRWDLLQDVGGCHDLGISSIGLWRPKVLEFGEERAIELLNDAALDVSSLSWIGGFTGTNGHGFRDSIWDAREAIRFAGKVGADTVVVLSGSRGSHTLNHARRLLLDSGSLGVISEFPEGFEQQPTGVVESTWPCSQCTRCLPPTGPSSRVLTKRSTSWQ